MIEGKIDTTKPGVYYVSLTYQGIKKEVNFIVLNKKAASIDLLLIQTFDAAFLFDNNSTKIIMQLSSL